MSAGPDGKYFDAERLPEDPTFRFDAGDRNVIPLNNGATRILTCKKASVPQQKSKISDVYKNAQMNDLSLSRLIRDTSTFTAPVFHVRESPRDQAH
ncbi:MAG: hypothetical protein ABJF89_08685 [Parasphingorhabdus sp.]|uniref:hypothetical protein n=1 Tax=Parasphingorhabdus sp. TaxID=2709688 RepID=UPI003266072A